MLDDFFEQEQENKNDKIDISKFREWDEDESIRNLNIFDEAYYTEGGEPLITDAEYDMIYSYISNKFSDNDYFSENIGCRVKGKKVKHKYIIGSLKKAKGDPNDKNFIDKWTSKYDKNERVVITPKYDGLSIICEYKNGKFFSATTRGNGEEGQDITDKARMFVPLETKTNTPNIIVRGEILLFGDIYKTLGKANRRNAASGIIGTDSLDNANLLNVIFYEIIECDQCNMNNEEAKMSFLKFLFDKNATTYKVKKIQDLTAEYLIKELDDTKNNFLNLFDCDGLVLAIVDSKRENIKYPENKIAFKYGNEFAIGIVKEVKWQTSRHGRICPVIELENPVNLSGADIWRATGYNAGYIRDNKICKGTKVKIIRSGDVIPRVIEVIRENI